ncbi:MAG: PD40 domain-containing protein [Gemmatimonadaceae bacterium]|nr:PD40 domain-containing protein [Gemmatimonadaceae bacterium]
MTSRMIFRILFRALSLCGSLALVAAAVSCGSDATRPNPLPQLPDFIYVSNAAGGTQLYTWHAGATTLFPGSVAGDAEPQSAAGKIVFTSYRISAANPEIFIANLDGSNSLRLTTDTHTDHQPSISPNGATVVWASTRSGTTRIWSMGADGSSPIALNTGSAPSIPESAPRFSPSGDRILFSSPRTNTTQIWIVNAAGDNPLQVTHDVNGAFFGSWSPDGNSIYFVDGVDRTVIHKVDIASGTDSAYVTGGTDVGDPACTAALCLVVKNATHVGRDIYAYIGAGDAAPMAVLNSSADEYEPAVLHP